MPGGVGGLYEYPSSSSDRRTTHSAWSTLFRVSQAKLDDSASSDRSSRVWVLPFTSLLSRGGAHHPLILLPLPPSVDLRVDEPPTLPPRVIDDRLIPRPKRPFKPIIIVTLRLHGKPPVSTLTPRQYPSSRESSGPAPPHLRPPHSPWRQTLTVRLTRLVSIQHTLYHSSIFSGWEQQPSDAWRA